MLRPVLGLPVWDRRSVHLVEATGVAGACSAWSQRWLWGPWQDLGSLPVPMRLPTRQSQALHRDALQEDEIQESESREVHTGSKENFISVGTVRQWHRLPCLRGCAVFTLGGFQDLSNLVWPQSWPAVSRLDQRLAEVPSILNHPVIPFVSSTCWNTTESLLWREILTCRGRDTT